MLRDGTVRAGTMRPALALSLAMSLALTGLSIGPDAHAQGVRLGEAPERGTRLPGRGSEEDREAEVERPARRIGWDPERTVPEGFRLMSGPRYGLVVGGAATFGFAYLTGVIFAAADVRLTEQDVEQEESTGRNDALYAPLIGPFVALGTAERPAGEQAILVTGGLLQAAGLTLAMFGLAGREHWLERDLVVDVGPAGVTLRASF